MMTLKDESVNTLLVSCERTRSKEARASLRRLLWDPLQKRGLRLHPDCLFSPEADILRAQEESKSKVTDSQWKCTFCDKQFRLEHFLDKHLARRHATLQYSSHTGVHSCLANLCGIAIPCAPESEQAVPPVSTAMIQIAAQEHDKQEAILPEVQNVAMGAPSCSDPVEDVEQRHRCSNIIRKCITPSVMGSEESAILERARLQRLLCTDARIVECMSHKERFAWSEEAKYATVQSLRHALGWMLLIIISVVVVMGRAMKPLTPRDPARGFPGKRYRRRTGHTKAR